MTTKQNMIQKYFIDTLQNCFMKTSL